MKCLVLLCPLLAMLPGCSRAVELGEVNGRVTLAGAPVANVLVTFYPEPDGQPGALSANGRTDADGRFQLEYQDGASRKGAPLGKHRVAFQDLAAEEKGVVRAFRFHSDASSVATTPHRDIQVKAGPQRIDFSLSPPPPRETEKETDKDDKKTDPRPEIPR